MWRVKGGEILKFQEYKQLDGSVKLQIAKCSLDILRRFDKTPYPQAPTDVLCPHFMLLAWANGCMYNCAWCYLKGTFRFYGQKPNGRIPQIYKERARIERDIDAFLEAKDLPAEIINTGELCDSLMDEGNRDGLKPFSEWMMEKFAGTKHRVLFLTKSTNVQNFLKHEWQKNAILSWSINAPKVSERWEKYAPMAHERLAAAKQVYDAGYEVRLRIDPMVAIDGWQEEYAGLVSKIFGMMKPTRVTLGCLRGLNTTLIYCKDKSWIDYLTEKSSWGRKPPFAQRLMMYAYLIGHMQEFGFSDVGVCKETLAMWEALQKTFKRLDFKKMKCNCV